MPFAATWMQLEIITLSGVSQKEKDKYHMMSWNIKYDTNELIYETETESLDIENRLVVAKGEGVGVSRCKLLYVEWINNKVLLYSTGSYIQYPMIKDSRKEYI